MAACGEWWDDLWTDVLTTAAASAADRSCEKLGFGRTVAARGEWWDDLWADVLAAAADQSCTKLGWECVWIGVLHFTDVFANGFRR